jgi:excisionase family DNA binding protein
MTTTSPPPLIGLDELASRLGVGERYVRRLVEERRIPYRKIGRLLRFDTDEVEVWIEACRRLKRSGDSPVRRRRQRQRVFGS